MPDAAPAAQKSERLHPLVELTLARVREFLREPEVIFWVFIFPVLLAFALGIAFRNTAPAKLRIAVEADQATGAQALTTALARSDEIDAQLLAPAEAAQALRSGKIALIVRQTARAGDAPPPAGAGPADAGPRSSTAASTAMPSVEYRYDPSRPDGHLARLVVDDALQRAYGRTDVARVRDERVTEPGARYIDYLIPGLLGLNLMGSGLWGVGFAIVTARMRKLLKRLAATPMRRSHYLLSFVLSRMLFLFLEVMLILLFARLTFGYKVHGSYALMALLLLVGALTFAGIGLLVAARPQTIEGVSGLMNLVMLPMWLLSGTFFSAARFPGFLQPFIKLLPLTALNDGLRAVMNEGATLGGVWLMLLILLSWCVVSFILALRLFRWQ
ncbi:MAG TPA: ABC transporter permease [Pyrinomonadaceae bacterium]|jgi:ABC-type multidrug transport system permease subunit